MVPRYYSQNTVLDYAALKAAFPASADKVHTYLGTDSQLFKKSVT